ncbi:D-alanyl-D-alanine carboxypeptidase/D-alanyl-D-alanine-endopeptidase (penicillin-binding protein 4) [Arthrobacter sp. AG258]|uniref:D-alanyl-D-alanine carboxypeptidase/D-alanyl-D-alanine-endopeptidase n=1 Tax=Arthrobacter sp. AG258 TaxID=2183899 RepID=UPI00105E0E90|nr:D-alanyl-D-alanine carboxypeptidase [Arthrobacter sp. AG258]TDT81755.1 D-alanyl-D-alanine carboxypeptidase/D-alanyl-D-alanine-endopeptidase (penicillin-binding protein 4) [Arthrobacter sp. AG258]
MSNTTGTESRRGRRSLGSAGLGQALRAAIPPVLVVLLLLVLAVPAALLVAPGFVAPGATVAAAPVPAWQQLPATVSAPQVLAPLQQSAPVPTPSAVAAQVDPLLATDGGGTFTGMVQDASTGQVLFDRGGSEGRVPASNLKLLTSAAALRTLGPDHRFATKVLRGPAPGQVVLVGGGDVLLGAGESRPEQTLGHAGLATLAAQAVDALRAAGTTGEITVLLDDSLFTGPALNPAWLAGDVEAGEIAPLYPLALNSARFDPAVTTGPRPQDAAMAAAGEFAARLRAAGAGAGLTVVAGVERAPGTAAAAGAAVQAQPVVLAEVESATVAEQVDLMLQVSDNYLAETMGRMAALATGRSGSNDGATAAVVAEAGAAGVATDTIKLADVCGLALGNQVSARQFTDVVRAMTTGADARLRGALDGFPVGGLSGTLDTRYGDAGTAGGAGLVRAKTGTLNTVLALSGYVVDADGRLLVFSFIGNGLTPGAAGNKQALDRAATVLAGCGCR